MRRVARDRLARKSDLNLDDEVRFYLEHLASVKLER